MTALVEAGTFSKDPVMFGLPKGTMVIEAADRRLKLWGPGINIAVRDFICGLGTNILGYSNPEQWEYISGFPHAAPSLSHLLEYRVADKLADMLGRHVPGWTPDDLGVRWCKTGSEATTMAVRLARAVTGRDYVVTFQGGYHGWMDWTISRSEPAWGVVGGDRETKMNMAGVVEVEWGNLIDFTALDGKIAAVIFETPAFDPPPDWLLYFRQWYTENNALLIADETVTGLRYGLGGASERYGIEPDLYCVGKALGNGFPINSLVGRRDYMEWFARTDPVFCSSTLWGETTSLAAADWVLNKWTQAQVDYIWTLGSGLISELRSAGWNVFGHGGRSVLRFETDVERAWFIHGMLQRGFLFNRPNFITTAHEPADIEAAGRAAADVRFEWNKVGVEEATKLIADKMPRVLFKER